MAPSCYRLQCQKVAQSIVLDALMSMEVIFLEIRSARNPKVILVNGIEQQATEQKTSQQKQSKTSIHEPTKVCTTESGVLINIPRLGNRFKDVFRPYG